MSSADHPVSATTPAGPPEPATVAPPLHTLVLVLVLLFMSALGAGGQQQLLTRQGRMKLYLFTLVWEWALLLYVTWGLHRRGVRLRQLIRGRWSSGQEVLRDIAIAVGFWMAAAAVLGAVGYLLGLTQGAHGEEARKLAELLPHGAGESAAWIALSASAGFCEEIIFRGYLQRQFAAWSGRLWVGVAVQALIFGAAHGYEGWRRMVLIAVYGVMFSALAEWRRSLRPGMMGHALQDSVAALGSFAVK